MKLILDSAVISEIEAAVSYGDISGVTTNPTLLFNAKVKQLSCLESIYRITKVPVYVQLIGRTADEMIDDYKRLMHFSSRKGVPLYVKVPIDDVGMQAIGWIKSIHPDQVVLGTAIYTLEQCMLAAMAGCNSIAPYFNRMVRNGIDAAEVISKARHFIDLNELECIIIGASFKDKTEVIQALSAGAHTCTVSWEIFKALHSNALVDEAVTLFNEHGLAVL